MNFLTYISNRFLNSGAIGKLCSLLFALCALTSCITDDFDGCEGVYNDGEIVIQFAIPDLRSVLTRAESETGINNLDAFVFVDGGSYIMHKNFNGSNISNNTISLNVGGQYKTENLLIYLVANTDNGLASLATQGNLTPADLREYELNGSINLNNGLPMIGFQTVSGNNTETSLTLTRAIAKVEVKSKDETATVSQFQVYKPSKMGYLGSPINIENEFSNFKIHSSVSENPVASNGESNIAYVYPSIGYGHLKEDNKTRDFENGAFVVVKVNRPVKGSETKTDQFYRINLRYEKEDESLDYLDLLANHHYEISITGFLSDGYSSYEEAAAHPESDQFVTYKIHDHALEVLSMMTDGYRELGVSPEVRLNTLKEGRTGILTVKCYDPDKIVAASEIIIEYPKEWLTIGEGKTHEKTDIIYGDDPQNDKLEDDPSPDYDPDNHGQQFDFEITVIKEKKLYEDMNWDLTVSWKGTNLSRKVKVSYEAAFLLPDVSDVTLTIVNNDKNDNEHNNQYIISDYWTFVTGAGKSHDIQGDAGEETTPHLYGIQPGDMTGSKKRMGGFHFPMPYGMTKNWEYVYSINFSELKRQDNPNHDIESAKIKDIRGDSFFVVNSGENPQYKVTLSKDNSKENTYTLKYTGEINQDNRTANAYQYAGGIITFLVTYSDGNTSEVSASLYHTGFFHYEGNATYVPATPDDDRRGYYYYEVAPMGDGFWLDRNIGATANTAFIDMSNDESIDRSAAGLHYTIIRETQDFKLPKWDFGMCPPGYHVPNETEWDAVRLSHDFETISLTYNNTVYMSTYYVTHNDKLGNIYLQKSMYYNEPNVYNTSKDNNGKETKYTTFRNNGDFGAGYYWSVTEAPAMEKEQMGNWLRALYLNGSASSYMSASVTDHRMPVRCKAGTVTEDQSVNNATNLKEYYVSFNVHNATHVYLYEYEEYEENGVKKHMENPLYTFPGKALGTTSSAEEWQHFYCSTTVNPEKLRVIFVKLEAKGKVTIFKKVEGDLNKFEDKSSFSYDYLDKENSWDIHNGAFYDFCDKAIERDVTELGDLLKIDNTNNKPLANVFSKQPSDCTASSGSGGGGGGGGDDTGLYEHERGESRDPEGTIIWEGEKSIAWDETRVDFDYWNLVPASTENQHSCLRIYGMPTGGGTHQVHIRKQGWDGNQGFFLNKDGFGYKNVDGYVEIHLYPDLLEEIRNKKLMICGENWILQYVTIVPEVKVPEEDITKLHPTPFDWKGNQNVTWGEAWTPLAYGYNWSQVPAGTILRLTIKSVSNCQFNVCDGNWGKVDEGIHPTSTTYDYPINRTKLNRFRNGNGLLIQGENLTITGATLIFPEGTGTSQ